MRTIRTLITHFGAAVIAAPALFAQEMTEEEAEACGQACGTACGLTVIGIPLLIGFLVSIGVAVYVYRDSKRRGDPNWLLWTLVGFFFNVLGLVIYVVTRPKEPPLNPPPPPPPPSGGFEPPPPPPGGFEPPPPPAP